MERILKMNKLNLKQGDRRIVNGQERAYHGSFGFGIVLDFIRQVNETAIEYCLFSNVSVDRDGELTGIKVSTYEVKPLSSPELVGNESIDLFARGKRILNMNKRKTN